MSGVYELMAPDSLLEGLAERKKLLKEVITVKNKALKTATEGRLRVSVKNGVPSYYKMLEKYSNGSYIRKRDLILAKKIAQKEYDVSVLEAAGKQIECLEKVIEILKKNDIEKKFLQLSEHKKCLIEPVTLTDEEYASRWQNVEYRSKPFSELGPELYTARGERVRSKSEVIIADTLNRLGIPYRYEFPVSLKRFDVYPDFYCLNVRTRREFIWEHFGLMTDSDYAVNMVEKLDSYSEKGWILGKNLIATMESAMRPLNTRHVERLVEEFLV